MLNRVAYWLISAAAALTVGIALFAVIAPTPTAQAMGFCDPDPCPSGQPFTTAMVWGKGADCDAARSDATTQALQLAGSDCGRIIQVCNFAFVTTSGGNNGCFFNGTEYQVDGYGKYNCTTCTQNPYP